MEHVKPAPGSSEAIAEGCTCSPTLNRHGQGTFHGQPRFYYHARCPIHREEVERSEREAGGFVMTVRKPPHDG